MNRNPRRRLSRSSLINAATRPVFFRHPLTVAVSGILLASALGVSPALAEETPVASTAADSVNATETDSRLEKTEELGAVVVTAQKRTQKLKDVPIPITAVKGDAIREKNVVLSTDIERLVPNLSAQGGGRTGKPRWFLRGIGTNDPNQNQDGPLGVYVDEVVVGLQKNQSFPLYDLERVEVLRGPQGTLWGKNNTGGAIHYVSKKPTFDKEGYARLGYGSYNTRTAETAVGGALIDKVLAGRASVYYESYDGWAKNILNDKDGPQLKDFNARFQLLANFTPNVDAQLIVSTRTVDSANTPSYSVGGRNAPGSAVTIPNPGGLITQGQTAAQIASGGGYLPSYGISPNAYSDFWGGDGYGKDKRDNVTLKLNWRLGDLTLAAITGLVDGEGSTLTLPGVPLGSTLIRTGSVGVDSSHQLSQELRLSSPVNQALSWILGAYYYKLDADSSTRTARFKSGTINEQYTEASWDQSSESKALFANGKYRFDDRLSLSLGLRVTRESKAIDETTLTVTDTNANQGIVDFTPYAWWQAGGVTGTGNFSANRLKKDNNWTKTTWDITPEYKFSKDVLTYARIATGFRSGGFNQSIVNGAIIETDPETLTDYELGAKTTWLEGRLTLNAALFYYDIKNLQLNIQQKVTDPVTGVVTTSAAGQSDGNIKGFELEADAFPVPEWRIGGSLGLLRSEYTDFDYKVGPVSLNASGNEFYRTPRTSVRLDTEYTLNTSAGKVVLATDWSYRSHIFHNATVQNDPIQETPAFTIGNARISYEPAANRKLQVSAFVNNLTDKNVAYLNQIVNGNGTYPVSVGSPRTWGVQSTLKF
ncbi:MAG TPA: TonB-dependent receptor [Fluviicoccus sp.]|nr:TonB-dependent receptor [Fluviicoccus sp.]